MEKTHAYYKICPFSVNYESVMFIVQAQGSCTTKRNKLAEGSPEKVGKTFLKTKL
jgi:hypothetical protein